MQNFVSYFKCVSWSLKGQQNFHWPFTDFADSFVS